MYHAGAVGALNALAEECTRIALILVKTICKKKVLRFSRDRIEEIAHDAAALIIARYLKSPEYTVRRFYAALWDAAQEIMFDGHRRRQKSFEDRQISMPPERQIFERYTDEMINPSTALDELVADHAQGKRIAIDLSRSKSYAMAIRRISCYVERQWIYEHAEKLHTIFKTLRWRPGKNRSQSENRVASVCGALCLHEWPKPEQPDRRADRISEG